MVFTQPPTSGVRLGCKLYLLDRPMVRLNLEIGALIMMKKYFAPFHERIKLF